MLNKQLLAVPVGTLSKLRWRPRGRGHIRADQNTGGGALLESPMRTAMHGKGRVSSAISVEFN